MLHDFLLDVIEFYLKLLDKIIVTKTCLIILHHKADFLKIKDTIDQLSIRL